MKVLVTGVSGRLGPFVVKDLAAAGHQLVLSSRREPAEDIRHFRTPSKAGNAHLFHQFGEGCGRGAEMLVDLRPKNVTGKVVANVLDEALITVNKNMIPFDPEKPFVTSGIRIGTPAVTTRGMKEAEMVKIAEFIERAIEVRDDEAALAALREEVKAFANKFPMPSF